MTASEKLGAIRSALDYHGGGLLITEQIREILDRDDDDPPFHRTAAALIEHEAREAREQHGNNPFASPHEGLGVIYEEWDEFADEIRANNLEAAVHEAIQLGAMALRFVADMYPRLNTPPTLSNVTIGAQYGRDMRVNWAGVVGAGQDVHDDELAEHRAGHIHVRLENAGGSGQRGGAQVHAVRDEDEYAELLGRALAAITEAIDLTNQVTEHAAAIAAELHTANEARDLELNGPRDYR